MLIYNKKLSVCPITTHLPLKLVTKNINKKLIIEKIKIINDFYKMKFNIKPKMQCWVLILTAKVFIKLMKMKKY